MAKILSTDTFTRANQSGLGTASDGETWSTASGSATQSIVSNEGHVTACTALTFLQLGTSTSATGEGLVRVKVNDTNITVAGICLRATGTTTFYRARFNSNNSAQGIGITKTIAGTSTTLFSASFTITTGSFYWLRFKVIGNTLMARGWLDGNTEPTTWNVSGTDTTIAATSTGTYGLCTSSSAGTSTWDFDNFTVTDGLSTDDASSRLRLAVPAIQKNSMSRARIASQTARDLLSRLRFSSLRTLDFSSRMNLSAGIVRTLDLLQRVRVMATRTRDGALRLPLAASRNRDTLSRVRGAAIRFWDIGASRFRLLSIQNKDSSIRIKAAALTLWNTSSRLFLKPQFFRVQDLRWRLFLKPQFFRVQDLVGRFPLKVLLLKDVSARFNIFRAGGTTLTTTLQSTIYGLGFAGSIILSPIPVGVYAMNSTVLPDLPILATAPPAQSGTVQVGSTFLILFSAASVTTRTLLANGVTGVFTFPLASGDTVSTTVQIQSSLAASILQVECIVTVPVTVNRYVIATQFF